MDTTPTPTSISRRLMKLAWPIIGLNVMTVLAMAVDTAMCGRLPNPELPLTALGFATQVVFLLMVAMIGLTVGGVALVARAFGAARFERVNHVINQSITLTVLLSGLVAVFGNLIAGPLLELLGATATTRDLGLEYLRPLLTWSVFGYLNILFAGLLRGVGSTRLAFAVALLSNLLNAFFNYLLILGNLGFPALGLEGAAYGTLLSQAIGAVVMIVMLRRGVIPRVTVSLRPRRIDRALARELIGVGAPAAVDMVIINASFLSIIGMLGRLDATAVAAHSIGLRVQSLAFVPGMSVAQATGALIGQSLGAGDATSARATVRAAVGLCTLIMSALAVLFLVASSPMVQVFDIPPGVPLHDLSVLWIELLGYGMPIAGLHIAFVGMLQGAGETRKSLAINLYGTAVQIPLSYVLGFTLGMGVFGVWVALPLSLILKAGLGYRAYRRGDWLRVGLRTPA